MFFQENSPKHSTSLQYGTYNSKLSLDIFKLMIPNQSNPNLDTYLLYSWSLRSCFFYLLFNPKFSWKTWEKIVHQTPSYFPATLKLLLYCISYAPAASNSIGTYFSLFASSLIWSLNTWKNVKRKQERKNFLSHSMYFL